MFFKISNHTKLKFKSLVEIFMLNLFSICKFLNVPERIKKYFIQICWNFSIIYLSSFSKPYSTYTLNELNIIGNLVSVKISPNFYVGRIFSVFPCSISNRKRNYVRSFPYLFGTATDISFILQISGKSILV